MNVYNVMIYIIPNISLFDLKENHLIYHLAHRPTIFVYLHMDFTQSRALDILDECI